MTARTRTPSREDGKVFLYFAPLTLLLSVAAPEGTLLDIATSFMLKNQLHATPSQVSLFRLVTAVPMYLAVLFGFSRDLWNPLGRRDRGFFLVFAPVTAAVFVWMAFSKLTFVGLFAGMMLVMVSFRFIDAAQQGLLALVGQERLMSGRISALWNTISVIPNVGGAVAAGWAAQALRPAQIFVLMAGLAGLIFVLGLWRPRAVFDGTYDQPLARSTDLLGDIRRSLRHRAIYPVLAIWFMVQFMPGFSTPLQFYLTDTLHAPDSAYGLFQAIFYAALAPAYLCYGWLCRRFKLKTLLWWGCIISVPQLVPLAFIHSAQEAYVLAMPLGMMGGIAAASVWDLTMRSCPPGLQGALMMLVEGFNVLSTRGSDVVGARIYAADPVHGFQTCVIATTVVYALVLPVLLFIPKSIIATADGEANPGVDAAVAAALAAG